VVTLRGFEGWPRGALHLAIGVFDGVHVGHQALIRHLVDGARAASATAVAATFDPLPIQVLAPGAPPSALSDARERAELLVEAGADAVVAFPFDDAFAAMRASEFVERLRAAGDVRRIVVGEDFRFGHDREGNVAMLRSAGPWEVDLVRPISAGGEVVSSTRIRNLLLAGRVEDAAGLLGRPYAITGRIEHGEKRGRALGYPTINVATPLERLLPRDGIYATWVTLGGDRHPAATSLGVRPTFGAGERVLESFLIDRTGDWYGQTVSTAFVRRLRDELRFASAEDLVRQIERDVAEARSALLG
jgi:riboflavin kinase/FMN adenylyltransferase